MTNNLGFPTATDSRRGWLPAITVGVLASALYGGANPAVPTLPNDQFIQAMSGRPHDAYDEPPTGCMVVEARVKCTLGPKHLTAVLEVTRVYAGEVSSDPHAFIIQQEIEGSAEDGSWRLTPQLKEGETGIWFVLAGKEPWTLHAAPAPPIRTPARDGVVGTRYPEVRQWAEAAKRIWDAAPQERWTLLEQLSHDHTSEVAAWAVWMLDRTDRKAAGPLLGALIDDEKVPAEAQILLDDLLSRNDRAFWTRSPQRRTVFSRWVAEPLEEPAGAMAIFRIRQAFRDKILSADDLMALMTKALENPHMAPDTHADAAWVLYEWYRDAQEDDRRKLFGPIAAQLRQATQPEVCHTLAGTLAAFPLDADRVGVIRALLPHVADATSKELLEDAIRKFQPAR